ncbi:MULTISPECIES: hypothetical protein [Catenuloplanes]|uniref:DUF2207 domain-containing protein n=1 Tax=Catenuloplanes niger TaxID=587534 RepID=A0AAE3ZL58_9ACTN|nr:hypothetical protein [Catenuloplanes niger]MDR7320927.1 hypothetical protein [Catenuloplanes niger]
MFNRAAALGLTAVALAVLVAAPARAHGFTSTVYVDVTADRAHGADRIRTDLHLEYDLLFVSAADFMGNDPLFREGDAAFQAGDTEAQAVAVNHHRDTIVGYVSERFTVTAGGRACAAEGAGAITIGEREGVPYAMLPLVWDCPAGGGHAIRSGLFPDSEEYVRDTTTRVTYTLDGRSGSVALTAAEPEFSTGTRWWRNPWVYAAAPTVAVVAVPVLLFRRRARSRASQGHSSSWVRHRSARPGS